LENFIKIFFTTFALLLSITAAHAALAEWKNVLTCDNGAAEMDNAAGEGRGGAGLAAQVVSSDGQSLTITTGGANWTFRNCAKN
jgi:hypothetical protein